MVNLGKSEEKSDLAEVALFLFMIKGMFGEKLGQTQKFNDKGQRLTISLIKAEPCFVTQVKSLEKDGYNAIQLGFGHSEKNNISKPVQGLLKKAGIEAKTRFLSEIRLAKDEVIDLKPGQKITIDEVFKPGDKIRISGISKGKGFSGVVKRWGFKGGPKTHGQSDRERAPGSIGQATTPGRVHKGKKMAGRLGGDKVMISGLRVLEIDKDKNLLFVSGLLPGRKGGLLEILKHGR